MFKTIRIQLTSENESICNKDEKYTSVKNFIKRQTALDFIMKTYFSVIPVALVSVLSFGSIACGSSNSPKINTGITTSCWYSSGKSLDEILKEFDSKIPGKNERNIPANDKGKTKTPKNKTLSPNDEGETKIPNNGTPP